MPVNPGRLRQRITIQILERIVTSGGYTETWVDAQSIWASVVQLSASGAARYAQAGYSLVTHEITLRAGPTLSLAKSRFTWKGRPLLPVTPPRDGDNTGRYLTIACREINPGETSPPESGGSSG